MAELVRISGLSHGTGVWLGNAQEIIRSGTATLQECICCRDDILQTLLNYHMDSKLSFEIMETVRKGKPLEPVMTESMKAANVPEWFINSCGMIQYLFPRGHAVAYVTMALRIAWFKVYRPQAFYAAYFTIRGTDFDANTMFAEKREIDREIDRLNLLGKKATAKEQSVCGLLEVVREMNARGIYFLPVDLYKSSASTFIIEGKNIRPPFSSLPSVGLTAAKNLYEGAKAGPYLSEEDIIRRTRVSKAVIEQLRKYRCLEGLSVSNQVSLFDGLLS
jgi:DNA polymerase-3 subunit alpha (Gram-positive type)